MRTGNGQAMKLDKFMVGWSISLACIILAVIFYHQWQHWLAYSTGSYNTPGVAHNYNAFSGSISDIGQYTVATTMAANVIMLWKHHTCPAAWWCWRRPHYQLGDTPHMICGHHHPDHSHETAKQALRRHHERHHSKVAA